MLILVFNKDTEIENQLFPPPTLSEQVYHYYFNGIQLLSLKTQSTYFNKTSRMVAKCSRPFKHLIYFFAIFSQLQLFIIIIATFEVIPVIITIIGITTADIPPFLEYIAIGAFGDQ